MFDFAGHRASSTFFKIDQYFYFIIVSAKNTISHKQYQTIDLCLGPDIEIARNVILIPSQNSFRDFS